MPELPEVETVRRTLAPYVVGRSVQRLVIRSAHCWEGPADALLGRRIQALERRGKHLVLRLAGGWVLLIHLRMTGRLLLAPSGSALDGLDRHVHAVIDLEGGGGLVFHDVRKFGRLVALPESEVGAYLPTGRDPLVDGLRPTDLAQLLLGRRGAIKPLLLRQDLLAGLGNIYADEALWRAGIHPERRAGSLQTAELSALASSICGVLREAIRWRGTTVADFRDARGRPGGFAPYLAVYRRAGKPCRRCGEPIQRRIVGGRSTHFCPHCQPPNDLVQRGEER